MQDIDPEHDDHAEDGGGFDADDWSRLKPFTGRVATLDDVQARLAVFALGDSDDPQVIDMDLPQPVIWWDDDGEQGAVAVQAEVHAVLVGHEGEVRQFVLTADASGQPVSREVRRFEIGSISEGCAADEATDALYLAEENVGVWRYGLDPASGDARSLIQPIEKDVLVADAEGLTILRDGEARYLIGSSQGDSAFPVWRIDGADPEYRGRFVVEDGVVDGVTGTDGLAAMGGRVSDAFPEGLVVVQDDVNDVGTQNFKYIDWRVIRSALGLD